jgi:hypothetical protein
LFNPLDRIIPLALFALILAAGFDGDVLALTAYPTMPGPPPEKYWITTMKTFSKFALAALLPLAMQAASAADWYPSAYGPNDEIGAANLLTPDVVKQAVGWSSRQDLSVGGPRGQEPSCISPS